MPFDNDKALRSTLRNGPRYSRVVVLAAGLMMLLAAGCGVKDKQAAEVELGALEALPGHAGRALPSELEYKVARLDPAGDGWDSEVASQEVSRRLSELGTVLSQPAPIRADGAAAWVAGDFAPTTLRPKLEEIYAEGGLRVLEASPGTLAGVPPGRATGVDALLAALTSLRAPFSNPRELKTHAKIVGVEMVGDELLTEVLWQAEGASAEGRLQQNAAWQLRWRRGEAGSLQLSSLKSSSHQEILGPASGEPLFEDRTAAVLGGDPAFAAQLVPGQRHWGKSLDKALGVDILGHHGLAIGDINGDGRDDLYVLQQGGLPNRLFVQQPDGTARDIAAQAGVDYLDRSTSALLIDLDNDGDQDLVVAAGPLIVHANDGKGQFKVSAVIPTFQVMSLAAADYDGDGDLDLYAARYSPPEETSPAPYHDANNGLPNLLLRNDGGLAFTDVTAASGIDTNNRRYSFAAAWEDYDDDGDADLYVANDFGRNNLYENDGGRFKDVAAAKGVEDISAGMSAAWGDYDGDGRMDLYVGNMFSSAGNRIAYQRRFQNAGDEGVRRLYQRHARGNSLFRNAGDGTFRDVSVDAGVTMARWAWSSLFADLNNDGRQDLYAANGYVTNDDWDDL